MKKLTISCLQPDDLFTFSLLLDDKKTRSIYRLVGFCSDGKTCIVEPFSYAVGVDIVIPKHLLFKPFVGVDCFKYSVDAYVYTSTSLKLFQSIILKGGVFNENN